jgi:hypothetical protein
MLQTPQIDREIETLLNDMYTQHFRSTVASCTALSMVSLCFGSKYFATCMELNRWSVSIPYQFNRCASEMNSYHMQIPITITSCCLLYGYIYREISL